MVWLDFIFIGIMVLIAIFYVIFLIIGIMENEGLIIFQFTSLFLFFELLCLFMFFLVVDNRPGYAIGEVTKVNRNFFGTTAVYIRTSETNEEKYCIEDSKIAEKAYGSVGEKIKLHHTTRIGLYSSGDCSCGPVDELDTYEKSK